jgi:YidC/Oxa1 family membrane protein insertase
MNFKLKDFIIPISLAFSITLIFQFLFFSDNSQTNAGQLESGRSHTAPRVQEVHRPLDLEINFIDTKPEDITHEKSLIETDFAKYVFSTDGASIEEIEYKHTVSGKDVFLKVYSSQTKEDRCLLVTFPEKTPFYYKLVKKEENADDTILIYRAPFEGGNITKKFVIFKHQCKVDLEIEVSLEKPLQEAIRLRIFYPSPLLNDIQDDVIQGVMNEGNSINKKSATALLQRYWEIPSLFGLEDRYFIHSMVKDLNNFSQRGYYKSSGVNSFFSILEGPGIKDKSSWSLSFYFGPKKVRTIFEVDPRLERTLDYGWLGPIAKPLLAILNFFYRFFGNYGIAIILLTILIKLLLLPFTLKGEQSMKKRLEFQKKLQYIQQKYKDDKEALAHARADLLKKHGMPDMLGCLPLLLQLPLFFALNRVLSTAVELYKAPFLWIPNLSARDPFFILPILIGISIILHSNSTDPRQRFSSYAMALLLAAFSAGLPAGLSLFIFMSTILTVIQTKVYTHFKKA